MDEIEIIKHRLDLTIKEIQNSIHYCDEDDDFTQGVRQGMIDALSMSEWLFDTIEEAHRKHAEEMKLTSTATPSENQMRLL